MRSRLIRFGVTLAALASLAIGGAALASASRGGSQPAKPAAPARSEQPDPAGANDAAEPSDEADSDNVQEGDRARADLEVSDSETGPSDGPGGYADTNPEADTQQEGSN